MVISPGSSIGPYFGLSSIGVGGMGEVYRAQDPRLGREVALKLIRRTVNDPADALDRLLREAALASSLNHPNIVTIYDTGVVGEDRYLAMELVDGSTLRTLSGQGIRIDRGLPCFARTISSSMLAR